MSSLCVKASFGSTLVRRVTFNQPPHSVSIDLFREKVNRDDDGDETEIHTSHDLAEAICYFEDSDDLPSSGASSNGSGSSSSKQRITLKVNLFVDYEGPSLSDRGSVVGTSESGSMSESGWGRSRASRSEWSESRDDRSSRRGDEWDDGWDERSGYDSRRGGGSQAPQSYYSSSTYSSHHAPPPLPPRPPSSYDPRHQSHPSAWPPRQPQPSPISLPYDTHSSYSYDNPPGQPARPSLHLDSHPSSDSGRETERRRASDESTRRRGAARSSNGGGSSGGSSGSGRTGLLVGRPSPSSDTSSPTSHRPLPLSAPPTYASGSNGSTSTSTSSIDVREELEQRWFKSQEERLVHFAAVKARREGRGSDGSSSSSSSEGGGDWPYQQHLDDPSLSASSPSSRRPLPPPQSHSAPSPSHQTLTPTSTSLDLPSFLASLSLTRPRMPAPSILSSVPDELLRCCGCGKDLISFRYICALCGPILPAQAVSDDGTQMERNEGEGAPSETGTEGTDGTEEGEGTPLLLNGAAAGAVDDPLGVNRARETALPISPLGSPTRLPPTTTTTNLILTDEGVFTSSPPPPPAHAHDLSSPPPALPCASPSPSQLIPHDHTPSPSSEEEDRGGFELCSDCIETEGVKHANEMAALARRTECPGSVRELKHSFCEVMKMGRGSMWQGWREVDYDDDVTCSTCGSGPVQTNRFKCISCPKMELCLACYRSVEEIHPIHSFLAIPDRPARPRSQSFPSSRSSSAGGSDPSLHEHATAEEIRLAFLRARGVGEQRGAVSGEPPRLPPKPLKHEGVLCFGCLSDIVGARYSCSQCPSFDLCSKCESLDPPITSPDGYHTSAHILLKINIPVAEDLILDATDRARAMSRDGGSSLQRRRMSSPRGRYRDHDRERERDRHARPPIEYERWYAARQQDPYAGGPPPLPPHFFGPPPPHYFGGGAQGPNWLPGPPPPPPNYHSAPTPTPAAGGPLIMRAHPRAAEVQSQVVHGVRCRGCRKGIQGIRWTCANCGTTPTFDLCSSCERTSHAIHNPLHCFLRLTQPLSKPLPPLSQFLPVLYDPSTPPSHYESANGTGGSGSGSSDGLGEAIVLHPQVICDVCADAIVGPWNRCCHCSTSFDVCTPCLHQIHHEPSHVFLKFTRKVDLALFRELTQLSTANPQPLLTYGVYS
ncbi:hypothetical protein BCR35DRAFT_307963 [Leucosporidium creatinivorum]|uniref:ZZ-type domain-containing protein n=1 Tax=Leucosporidium creatinivorum TaxID=106004 RepID=A0A1Y2EGF4_9BASI|nr:hypothetical protein BCR35DRAFT_307963 [Leucosporidium creatinivorum]